MKKLCLKLGTRRSLLAWAQSSWVAKEVERLNPGVQVELVGIETRGDRILDIPLQKVAGKEFFVAEIDEALAEKRVDFTVHSLKDLSLDRPEHFVSAAIPKRANPRDVVLFGPRGVQAVYEGKKVRIGTSSPRRLENIPKFLDRALPRGAKNRSSVQFVEIRGNVNSRLGRVHETDESGKYLDGVVLAFAGLIRLWADSKGRTELEKLLQGVRWMVLPVQESPAAAGQGALAIECRAEDRETFQAIHQIHHAATAKQVASERQILADWGGGCHQRFGATAVPFHSGPQDLAADLLWIRGVKPDGTSVEELQWKAPSAPAEGSIQAWDGSKWRSSQSEIRLEVPALDQNLPAIFVAHSRAVHGAWAEGLRHSRVWTSGTASWFKLADQGVWVEGCAEGLGFESVVPALQEAVLGLPSFHEWNVLTHDQALDDWTAFEMKAIGTYHLQLNYGQDVRHELKTATHIFWSSGSQLNALKQDLPGKAHHACGPGKTAVRLKEMGIVPQIFPSVEEWRKWLRIPN